MIRRLKLAVLFAARALGLFALARALTGKGVRILCYHGAWLGDPAYPGDGMFIKRTTFRERLARLRQLGYQVVPLGHAVAGLRGQAALPAAPVVITIDDGWYSTYAEMLPALQAEGMHATLYCDTANLMRGKPIAHMMARYIHLLAGSPPLSGIAQQIFEQATNPARPYEERWQATLELAQRLNFDPHALISSRAFDYMTPDELRQAFAGGLLDIQLHTHNHTLGDLSLASVRGEVAANTDALVELLAVAPEHFQHFCYPSGVKSASAEAALEQLGMASSTSVLKGLAYAGTPLQALPRFLDGDNVYRVEFEAELSGFLHLCRTALASLASLTRPPCARMPVESITGTR